MNQPLQVFWASLLIAAFSLTGCASKEAEEEVQEKTPPDVIQLGPQAVLSAGIQTVTVLSGTGNDPLITTGQIVPNENQVFHVNSFVSGRVVKDNVNLGDRIQQGQTLAVIQNLDVAKVQAEYIHELHQNEINIEQAEARHKLAQQSLARERQLLSEGISPRRDYQQAEAEATMAKSQLEGQREHRIHINSEGKALLGAYGMRPGSVHSETIRTGSPVSAPRAGIITKKNVTLGDMVTPEAPMYEVTDLSQLWLDLAIYPKDLNVIREGQTVSFTTDSLPGRSFIGRIDYIQPGASEAGQTYVARAFLQNVAGQLKPGMFGQARIEGIASHSTLIVPFEAVQKYGREEFVFIPLGANRYQKRTVLLGNRVGAGYQVKNGLQAGEKVIGKGSFTLKAEMLKSQFAEEE